MYFLTFIFKYSIIVSMYELKSLPHWSKNLIAITIIALNLTLIVSAFSLLVYWSHYSVVSINFPSKQQDLYQNQWMFWLSYPLFILSIPSSIATYLLITELIDDNYKKTLLFYNIIFGLKFLLLVAIIVIYATLLIINSMLIYYNNNNNLSGYNSLLIAVLIISILNVITIIGMLNS